MSRIHRAQQKAKEYETKDEKTPIGLPQRPESSIKDDQNSGNKVLQVAVIATFMVIGVCSVVINFNMATTLRRNQMTVAALSQELNDQSREMESHVVHEQW